MSGFAQCRDVVTHDQMIEHPDIDHLEDLGQGSGEFDVLWARRMLPEGWLWARMTADALSLSASLTTSRGWTVASVDRTPEHLPPGQHLMLAVEKQTGKHLVFQAGELEADGLLGGSRGSDRYPAPELITAQPAGFEEDGFLGCGSIDPAEILM